MRGYATVNGAATILNAVAIWKGSAFGIDLETSAEVELNSSGCIKGDVPGVDTRLVERSVELVLKRFGYSYGGVVRTWSEIPVASGLKSSSAAANALRPTLSLSPTTPRIHTASTPSVHHCERSKGASCVSRACDRAQTTIGW